MNAHVWPTAKPARVTKETISFKFTFLHSVAAAAASPPFSESMTPSEPLGWLARNVGEISRESYLSGRTRTRAHTADGFLAGLITNPSPSWRDLSRFDWYLVQFERDRTSPSDDPAIPARAPFLPGRALWHLFAAD